MLNIRIGSILIALGFLAGCASGPKYSQVQESIPKLKANDSRIFFYREKSAFGAVAQPTIRVNEESVGRAKPGGFFFIDKAPGTYEISTRTEVKRTLELTLQPGQTQYVKTEPSLGFLVGRLTPVSVSVGQALAEMGELSYIGTPLSALKKTENSSTVPTNNKGSTKFGSQSYVLERLALEKGCKSERGAELIRDDGAIERYQINCDDGTTTYAYCEHRQCSLSQ